MLKYAEHVNILTGCTSLFASITSPSQLYFFDTSTHSKHMYVDDILIFAIQNIFALNN